MLYFIQILKMNLFFMPFIVFLTAFIISAVAVPSVKLLAFNKRAIALPGRRHVHSEPTPKFGGIAIALGVLLISPFIFTIDKIIASYLASSAIMLILGIIDDVKGTGWKLKLTISIIATSIFIFGSGIWIKTLGNLFGTGEIYLGIWGIPFTYLAVFGIINAINLIDGLNGLACGVSAIAFITFAAFGYMDGNHTVFYLGLATTGATMGLFKYNYPDAKIFMGDSGSLFIGYSLSVLAILLTQGNRTIDPMVPVIVLGLPIFDTVRVMIFRSINKKHPFSADKTHLHYLMMRSGTPAISVVKTIWFLSCLMSFLAFLLHSYEGWFMLLVFTDVAIVMGIFIENLRALKTIKKQNTLNISS